MLCYIYKSLKKDGLYVYIGIKDDFSRIPKPLYDSIGEPEFVMELELTPERTLARENPEQVMRQIENKGFFIQMPPTQMSAPKPVH